MRIAEAQLVRAIHELSLEKGLGAGELGKALKNFLIRKRLTKRAGKVLRMLESYEDEQEGRVTVQATTAYVPTIETKHAIEKQVSALFGKEGEKAKIVFHEDREILGGVRLETGNSRYDFSLSRLLNELRKSFSK